MKILIFSLMSLVGLMLVALQHERIGRLQAENASLAQSAAEANQLKSDLAKAGADTQDATEEIERLREENHDLLRLRNEVNQLSDAKAEFEKVSAENQRLQLLAKNAPKPDSMAMQPIVIRMDSLYDRGLSTPEAAVQTFLWAEHNGNVDALSRCVTPERWSAIYYTIPAQGRESFVNNLRHNLDAVVSTEIVARRELNATTVQIGIQTYEKDGVARKKIVMTLTLHDGEWKVSVNNLDNFYL